MNVRWFHIRMQSCMPMWFLVRGGVLNSQLLLILKVVLGNYIFCFKEKWGNVIKQSILISMLKHQSDATSVPHCVWELSDYTTTDLSFWSPLSKKWWLSVIAFCSAPSVHTGVPRWERLSPALRGMLKACPSCQSDIRVDPAIVAILPECGAALWYQLIAGFSFLLTDYG